MKINISTSAALVKGSFVAVRYAKDEWYLGTVKSVGKVNSVITFNTGEALRIPNTFRSVVVPTSKKKTALSDKDVKSLALVATHSRKYIAPCLNADQSKFLEYKRFVDAGEINSRMLVKVSEWAPGVAHLSGWCGFWTCERGGAFATIYLEKRFVDAVFKKKAWAVLKDVIDHERDEYKLAVDLARKKGHVNPYPFAEDLGGVAHDMLVKPFPKYDTWLDEIDDYLGLK